MRYEDWTFREAEVRLSEHSELRSALGLNSVPDYTTLYRFLARLDPADVARVMNEIRRRMPGSDRSPATVAIDATGLAQAAVSRYFIRRIEHFGQPQRTWKHWLKWLTVVDVDRQLTLGEVRVPRPRGRPRLKLKRIIADRSYDSDPLRERFKRRGIELIVPYRKNNKQLRYEDGCKLRRYKRRWIVERANAWLGQFRRLLVRHEHLLTTYRAFSISHAYGSR
jgi:transposase